MKTTVTLKGTALSCRLVNISADGALITASFQPAVGTAINIDLPGTGPVTATVLRVTSAYIALSFDVPVDIDVIAGDGAPLGISAPVQATA